MVSWMALVVFVPIVLWVAISKVDVQPGENLRTPPPHAPPALDRAVD